MYISVECCQLRFMQPELYSKNNIVLHIASIIKDNIAKITVFWKWPHNCRANAQLDLNIKRVLQLRH